MRSTLTLTVLAALAVACGHASSDDSNGDGVTRSVKGNITVTDYALDNPVVVARSADGRQFLSAVQADGTFSVSVTTGVSYRLLLANTRRDGSLAIVSRISWTTGMTTAWARIAAGAALDVGHVRPTGGTVATRDHGSGGGGDDDGATHEQESETETGETRECRHGANARADLPYDVRPPLGSTFTLTDAFLFKGPLPASVVSVTMDGGSWRLAELQANTPFVITQADCDHEGNRSTGRDRVFVTWTNADGSQSTDHLDLRYCEGGGSRSVPPAAPPSASSAPSHDDCEDDDTPMCSGSEVASECDAHGGVDRDDDAASQEGAVSNGACGADAPPPASAPPAQGGAVACTVDADCAAGMRCFASTCIPGIN